MQVPAPFEYERATSVENALQLLAQLGSDGRILAGGYSLLPMMKLRLATPKCLVDIDDLAGELGYVEEDGDLIRIGAMTRHRDLLDSPLLARVAPIFRDAEREIADPVVRNRGTIGGALCQADPSEDLSAVCTAVDAEIVIRSLAGERTLHMDDFYLGPYRTAVGDDEMVVEIRVPLRAATSSAYEKINRRVGDWAVAAAGAALTVEDGVIADAGIALVAVGSEVASTEAREALVGRPPSEELFEEAAAAGAAACTPITDQRGSAEYKRHAVGVLAARAMGRAAERLGAGVA
jgi:carbon-monoxide dehydrogenase medium subunit